MDVDVLKCGQHHAPVKINYGRVCADVCGRPVVGTNICDASVLNGDGFGPRTTFIDGLDLAVRVDSICTRCGVRWLRLAARSRD